MSRDGLRFTSALKHEQLGKDSNSLEPDRERPKNLGEPESVIENQGENDARAQQVFDAESVNGGVVRRSGSVHYRRIWIEPISVMSIAQDKYDSHLYLNFMRYRMYTLLPMKNSFMSEL